MFMFAPAQILLSLKGCPVDWVGCIQVLRYMNLSLNYVQVAQEIWISSQGIYGNALMVVVASFDVDAAGAC
jgi:hypothetical protein